MTKLYIRNGLLPLTIKGNTVPGSVAYSSLDFANLFLCMDNGSISKIIIAPQAAKPILALKRSANTPAYRFPNGVDPAITSVYMLITLPLYSLLELSCKVEFA